MSRALAAILVSLAVAASAGAEPLGRLFYTPAQRAQLDGARVHRTPAVEADAAAEAEPPPSALTYTGVVRRSDGKSTLWINQRVVSDGEALSNAAVVGAVRADGGIRLRLLQRSDTIDLKVGQTVEMDSGTVAENYARREPAAKAIPAPATQHPDASYSAIKRRLAGRMREERVPHDADRLEDPARDAASR